jgi:squalene-associated FAD-dependent desaturase
VNALDVVVVGGGLAGLSAALRCADAGLEVTLLEGRPRLGGATWSFRRGDLWVDNGQHVFLRCCSAYRGFLRRLGVEHKTVLQERLEVPVADENGRLTWLCRSRLPAPLHLAPSLLGYRHLPFGERLRVAALTRALGSLDLRDRALDRKSLGQWLLERGASESSLERFWDLMVRGTLNAPAREASLRLAAKVFQTGLLESADGADIGYAEVPLQELHGDAAGASLREAGVSVRIGCPVAYVEASGEKTATVLLRGAPAGASPSRYEARAVIVAVDHEAAATLLPPESGIAKERLTGLGRAPIVNLHVVYDRRVIDRPFVATVGSPLQWVFDRTRPSGAKTGQVLAVSLSAAEEWLGQSREALRARFVPELERLLPEARRAKLVNFFVTCERAATFDQRAGDHDGRVATRTEHPALFLAGAWTDTGWPATMEGAVRSGESAARAALGELGVSGAPDAASA